MTLYPSLVFQNVICSDILANEFLLNSPAININYCLAVNFFLNFNYSWKNEFKGIRAFGDVEIFEYLTVGLFYFDHLKWFGCIALASMLLCLIIV